MMKQDKGIKYENLEKLEQVYCKTKARRRTWDLHDVHRVPYISCRVSLQLNKGTGEKIVTRRDHLHNIWAAVMSFHLDLFSKRPVL